MHVLLFLLHCFFFSENTELGSVLSLQPTKAYTLASIDLNQASDHTTKALQFAVEVG